MRRLRKESREGQTASLRGADQSGRQSGLRILNARYNETNDFFPVAAAGNESAAARPRDRRGHGRKPEDGSERRISGRGDGCRTLPAGGRGEPRRTSDSPARERSRFGRPARRRHLRPAPLLLLCKKRRKHAVGRRRDKFQGRRKTRTGSLSRHRAIRRMDERRHAPALPPRLRLLQHDARRTAGPAGALRGTRPLHSPAGLCPSGG